MKHLTPKHQHIINTLTEHGPQTIKQLHRRIPGSKQALYAATHALTQNGHIQRLARGLYGPTHTIPPTPLPTPPATNGKPLNPNINHHLIFTAILTRNTDHLDTIPDEHPDLQTAAQILTHEWQKTHTAQTQVRHMIDILGTTAADREDTSHTYLNTLTTND